VVYLLARSRAMLYGRWKHADLVCGLKVCRHGTGADSPVVVAPAPLFDVPYRGSAIYGTAYSLSARWAGDGLWIAGWIRNSGRVRILKMRTQKIISSPVPAPDRSERAGQTLVQEIA